MHAYFNKYSKSVLVCMPVKEDNMSDWNPTQYMMFASERTQPSIDLAVRLKGCGACPKTIADIGCGAGNSTVVLKSAFADADIVGIDSSENMIERARAEHPKLRFELCDALSLEERYDLLFSNACLQWIDNHEQVIPALMQKLNDGGMLAVQMPFNGEEPLFKLISKVSAEWGLNSSKEANGTLEPSKYYDILCGCASEFDIWETKYYHRLANHRALVEFVKGSRLRPYLDQLSDEDGKAFEAEIEEHAKALYPVMADGKVILGFRRLFFTAKK